MNVKKILINILFIVIHLSGIIFSVASGILLLVHLTDADIGAFRSETLNILLSAGMLIGLPVIGLITILTGRSVTEKRAGYAYLLFGICAIIITLKVILIDKTR